MTNENRLFNDDMVSLIMRILKRGNSAEIKKEKNKLVIVEIRRQVKSKTSING